MKKSSRLIIYVFALAGCAKTARPMEFGTTIPNAEQMDVKTAGNIIVQAGAGTYWMLKPESDGLVKGILDYKNYRVEVDIVYTAEQYKIHFVQGLNMDNGSTEYRKAYNTWIKRLDWSIRKAFSQYALK